MTVPIDSDTYRLLGAIQRQHDGLLNSRYHQIARRGIDLGAIARDAETVYHLDAVEAIGTYLEAHDNP